VKTGRVVMEVVWTGIYGTRGDDGKQWKLQRVSHYTYDLVQVTAVDDVEIDT
jgi:hypothetical protein